MFGVVVSLHLVLSTRVKSFANLRDRYMLSGRFILSSRLRTMGTRPRTLSGSLLWFGWRHHRHTPVTDGCSEGQYRCHDDHAGGADISHLSEGSVC